MYEVFSRRWWSDKACTIPAPNARKTHIAWARTEDEAQEICRQHNTDCNGNRVRRPYGSAWEYRKD